MPSVTEDGPEQGSGAAGAPAAAAPALAAVPARERRPLVERLGMGGIAVVLALLFAAMAVASWANGEGFLAVMAGIGALMTAWAGANTLFRG
ncbi:MAG TPA: hypothetical protein VFX65_09090 [Candidatus Limnocylindrales bacterium]|nr:hypothetical protein [Candidatus Limnocylindrales bacterium]